MKKAFLFVHLAILVSVSSCRFGASPSNGASTPGPSGLPDGTVIDHEFANVDGITAERVQLAKDSLRIAYWHTSHGSQLIVGVGQDWSGSRSMDDYYGGHGWYLLNLRPDGPEAANGLYLEEPGPSVCQFVGEAEGWNLDESIDRFAQAVRDYLDDPVNASINVVMASWCGGASNLTATQADHYLSAMTALEGEYRGVAFVYMTGHADGTGLNGNLHLRNRQIRDYCELHGKWLFDFYDIECYDPDGAYFGDRYVTDGCNYDANDSGNTTESAEGQPNVIAVPTGGDGNWALEWQAANPTGWWDCPTDYHTYPVNRNMKAKAAWQMWLRIAESR